MAASPFKSLEQHFSETSRAEFRDTQSSGSELIKFGRERGEKLHGFERARETSGITLDAMLQGLVEQTKKTGSDILEIKEQAVVATRVPRGIGGLINAITGNPNYYLPALQAKADLAGQELSNTAATVDAASKLYTHRTRLANTSLSGAETAFGTQRALAAEGRANAANARAAEAHALSMEIQKLNLADKQHEAKRRQLTLLGDEALQAPETAQSFEPGLILNEMQRRQNSFLALRQMEQAVATNDFNLGMTAQRTAASSLTNDQVRKYHDLLSSNPEMMEVPISIGGGKTLPVSAEILRGEAEARADRRHVEKTRRMEQTLQEQRYESGELSLQEQRQAGPVLQASREEALRSARKQNARDFFRFATPQTRARLLEENPDLYTGVQREIQTEDAARAKASADAQIAMERAQQQKTKTNIEFAKAARKEVLRLANEDELSAGIAETRRTKKPAVLGGQEFSALELQQALSERMEAQKSHAQAASELLGPVFQADASYQRVLATFDDVVRTLPNVNKESISRHATNIKRQMELMAAQEGQLRAATSEGQRIDIRNAIGQTAQRVNAIHDAYEEEVETSLKNLPKEEHLALETLINNNGQFPDARSASTSLAHRVGDLSFIPSGADNPDYALPLETVQKEFTNKIARADAIKDGGLDWSTLLRNTGKKSASELFTEVLQSPSSDDPKMTVQDIVTEQTTRRHSIMYFKHSLEKLGQGEATASYFSKFLMGSQLDPRFITPDPVAPYDLNRGVLNTRSILETIVKDDMANGTNNMGRLYSTLQDDANAEDYQAVDMQRNPTPEAAALRKLVFNNDYANTLALQTSAVIRQTQSGGENSIETKIEAEMAAAEAARRRGDTAIRQSMKANDPLASMEEQRLKEKILSQAQKGETPDPALIQQLNDLRMQRALREKDQGNTPGIPMEPVEEDIYQKLNRVTNGGR